MGTMTRTELPSILALKVRRLRALRRMMISGLPSRASMISSGTAMSAITPIMPGEKDTFDTTDFGKRTYEVDEN
ncbi:hypothetical protein PAJL_111 [Cutibacterium acnes HL042PA3]|nr:hypothetical protein PAZ_c13730 [Cutibacterium acnes 266]ESK59539.1 hypothetical protein PAJL_111 [Cutibacterium acnes HL042PA3]